MKRRLATVVASLAIASLMVALQDLPLSVTRADAASVTQNRAIQVSAGQAPTAVSFALGPANVRDNAAEGTAKAAVRVATNDGQPFAGSLSISSQSAADMVSLSATAIPSSVPIASANAQDDGLQSVTVTACDRSSVRCVAGIHGINLLGGLPGGGGDPTVGLLPPNRSAYAGWRTAGLQTVGGIPHRSIIYKTLSPSGGDDTAAVQAALNACPANQVVQLTAGVFRINGNGLYFRTPNCTLRGAGPGNPALNTGINTIQASNSFTESCMPQSSTNSIYCADPSATQLIKADRATNTNFGILYVQPSARGFGTSTNLAADAVQGTNTLILASWPNPGINVGDYVLIDINTDNDPDVVRGPSFGPPGDGTRRWFSRQDRSISQIMEVTGVNSSTKTITFSTAFHMTFPVAYQAQLTQSNGPFLKEVGIENLFLWGGMGGDGHGDLAMTNCAYCWVSNVQAMWAIGTAIGFYGTFRSELRDSDIHESSWPNPGGGGYLIGLNTGASDNLVENNIMWNGNKEVVMRGTGGGNVLGYNYTDDSFDNGPAVISSEGGINAGHYTTPHMELLEGNYSQNYKGDSYWGNSIYITAFRNQFSSLRAAHLPLKTYVVTQGNCHYPYGDWNNRVAVDVQAYNYYTSFIGNVLGFDSQTLLTNPYNSESCFQGKQTKFVEQVDTTAQNGNADGVDAVIMWRFGSYQATVNSTGSWTFVDSTINTQLRQGNWDWVTRKQHWYGIGGTIDGAGGSPVTIPNSFYLKSKPSFFGGRPWPWVDPTAGIIYTLPAKYCFEHNLMPTCLR